MVLFGYHQIFNKRGAKGGVGHNDMDPLFLFAENGNVPGCPVRVGLIGAERALFDAALVGVGVRKAFRLGLIIASAKDEYSKF